MATGTCTVRGLPTRRILTRRSDCPVLVKQTSSTHCPRKLASQAGLSSIGILAAIRTGMAENRDVGSKRSDQTKKSRHLSCSAGHGVMLACQAFAPSVRRRQFLQIVSNHLQHRSQHSTATAHMVGKTPCYRNSVMALFSCIARRGACLVCVSLTPLSTLLFRFFFFGAPSLPDTPTLDMVAAPALE